MTPEQARRARYVLYLMLVIGCGLAIVSMARALS
jgi:hypothetical protein